MSRPGPDRGGGRSASRTSLSAVGVLLLLAALALGPVLLHRGYVLVGDMTFVPRQPWKAEWLGLDGSVPRAVPADAVVWLLGVVIPGDLLQKAVLYGTLLLAGLGVFRVAGRVDGIATAARLGGGVLYLWNPFVFERLAIGHWGLLVGHAALPWVLAAALDVRRDVDRALPRLALLMLVAAVGSPTGGLVAALVAVVVVADRARQKVLGGVLGAAVAVNLPWLAPAVLNDAAPSDPSGVQAFAAHADTPAGTWGSLLTFGGIWKAAVVPGERAAWILVVVALLLSAGSLVVLVRRAAGAGAGDPLVVTRLLALAVVGLVLAGLPATGPGERLVTALVDAVPGAGLWRDSQKWLLPFVLVTAVGFALFLDGLARWIRHHGIPAAVVGALALVPVVLLPSLAWGLSGRYSPVSYPDEWMTVRRVLDDLPAGERRIAVLPWSAYQRLPWNDGRAALDPAIRFFPGQVVTNEDLSITDRLTVRAEDRSGAAVGAAIAAGDPLGPALRADGIRYLLVERTAPSLAAPALPAGEVVHDGPQLLLLDLSGHARQTRSAHRATIVAADLLAVLAATGAVVSLVLPRARRRVRYHAHGSSTDGGDAADYR